MRSKGTIGLLLVVIVLGAYTYWDFYSENKEKEHKEAQSAFFQQAADQVSEVIIDKNNQKIRLEKTADGWFLKEPLEDLADSSSTDDFVNSMIKEKNLGVAAEGANLDWALYGLNNPQGFIQITNNAKLTQKIFLSSKKNFEGNALIKKEGDSKVYVGSSQWQSWLEKTPLNFRDKRLLRNRIANVESLKFKNKNGEFGFSQTDGKWVNVRSAEMRMDQNKIRELLSAIGNAQVEDILSEKVITAADKKKYQLDNSEIRIELKLKDSSWSVDLSKSKDNLYYAVTSHPVFLVKLGATIYDKFKDENLQNLREKRYPFEFNKDLAQTIEVHTPLKKLKLVKRDNNWDLEPKNEKFEVQPDKINSFLDSIKLLLVGEFLPGSDSQVKPKNNIWVTDKDGKPLIKLDWDVAVKKKVAGVEKSFLPMKSDLAKEAFLIEESLVTGLGIENLAKEKVPIASSDKSPNKEAPGVAEAKK